MGIENASKMGVDKMGVDEMGVDEMYRTINWWSSAVTTGQIC